MLNPVPVYSCLASPREETILAASKPAADQKGTFSQLSRLVGIDSFFSAVRSFGDGHYRKSFTQTAEGVMRIGLTFIALSAARIGYEEKVSHPYRLHKNKALLDKVTSSVSGHNYNQALNYARQLDLYEIDGYKTILVNCLKHLSICNPDEVAAQASVWKNDLLQMISDYYLTEEKNVDKALNAAWKISLPLYDFSLNMRQQQMEKIAKYCLGEQNISCTMKAVQFVTSPITRSMLENDLRSLCLAKCNNVCLAQFGFPHGFHKDPFGDSHNFHKKEKPKGDSHNFHKKEKPKQEPPQIIVNAEEIKVNAKEMLEFLNVDIEKLKKDTFNHLLEPDILERKCRRALHAVHPDKQKEASSNFYVSIAHLCAKLVPLLHQ